MTQPDGSKEWWLEPIRDDEWAVYETKPDCIIDTKIHVIEHSAYEAAIRGINLQQDQISSLEQEVACLRSVLSEYNDRHDSDHTEFVQMIRANELADLRKK